jgi:phosphoenolpyruvate carboxykinase (GTP)
VTEEGMLELLKVDEVEWRAELPSIRQFYARFDDRLPEELIKQVEALERRLS